MKILIIKLIKLSIPIILWLICQCWLAPAYFYNAGIASCQSKSNGIFMLGLLIYMVLFFAFLGISIFLFVKLFIFSHEKTCHKWTQSLAGIILFFAVITMGVVLSKPIPHTFLMGVKQYFEKEINLNQFQQWVESDQIDAKMIDGEMWIDDSDVPLILQNDIKKLSPMCIKIKVLPSGLKYLRLENGSIFDLGSFGFVTGVGKDELPYRDKITHEDRIEINKKTFVWFQPVE
jgi:hypothetical protein